MGKGIFTGLVIFGLITFCVVGWTANLYVPSQYSTIQSAINAASNGDTIYVSPGTYQE
ncbi:MAG: hypothetical protein AB1630_12690 [bacterium]